MSQKSADELKFNSLINILEYEAKNTQDLLDHALNQAIKLTQSQIGYIYHYSETKKEFTLNSWSREVMKQCTIQNPETVYKLEKTGVWGEAVRQRKPIIINNFQAPHPLKKGYPSGHAPLLKYLTLPIFRRHQIVAVVGVANKKDDYTPDDVNQLSLLMSAVWIIYERQLAIEDLRQKTLEYEKVNKFMIDRELRMAELKEELNRLKILS